MSARACCNVATRLAKLGQLALPWNLSEAVWIRHDRFFPEKCFGLNNMSCKGILGLISPYLQILRPCGPMDKAPDFGSGDCRFESCHGRLIFVSIRITLLSPITLFAKSSTGLFLQTKTIVFCTKRVDRDRTRTCNPQIRSLVPYPLGHTVSCLGWISPIASNFASYQYMLQ